jgi:hypothetical protein
MSRNRGKSLARSLVKVTVKAAAGFMLELAHKPSPEGGVPLFEVCPKALTLVQVTLPPCAMLSDAGEKVRPPVI